MKTIKLAPGERLVTNQLNRKGVLPQNIVDAARDIVANVRANGDAAVRDYCQRFDGVELQSFRLPQEQIDAALEGLDPAFAAALEKAARQIREFHQREVEQSWFTTRADGTMLGVKVTPLAAAGIYVPGGRAQYPSTVLMNAIPAKVAGVERVVMVTPPQKDGLISPYTLAAAKLGGVDEIYMVGGAQAVAALAYGTETIPRVDKITGPGNAFVAAAKQIVSGDVGIDILVAQSPRAEITCASLDNEGAIVVAADMAAAVEAVNTVAPEHLELHCKDAMGLLGGIRNAGAIFVGAWSSEPLGDYVAGPNHTLPTGGTAMFSNPLSVEEFVKRSSVICYTPEGLLSDAPATQRLAEAEGLWAHALSAALRRRVLERGEDAVSAESLAAADLTKVAWPGDAVATVAEGVDLAAAGADGAGVTGGEA